VEAGAVGWQALLWYHNDGIPMTPRRATGYVGLTFVAATWLANATGLSLSSTPPRQSTADRTEASQTQIIANDIQTQAPRLRERLAVAPAPREPFRNPFTFAARNIRHASTPTGTAGRITTLPSVPAEPPLQLIGVAERETSTGVVRTAMITADSDELFMLIEGDTLGARYRVKAVGPEAVELTDLVTAATRRLTLR
jgi:hypothetical protein